MSYIAAKKSRVQPQPNEIWYIRSQSNKYTSIGVMNGISSSKKGKNGALNVFMRVPRHSAICKQKVNFFNALQRKLSLERRMKKANYYTWSKTSSSWAFSSCKSSPSSASKSSVLDRSALSLFLVQLAVIACLNSSTISLICPPSSSTPAICNHKLNLRNLSMETFKKNQCLTATQWPNISTSTSKL